MDLKRLKRAQEFAELMDRYRPGRTAWLLRVHRTTLARWAKGEVAIPEAALRLLRLMATGNVPGMAGKWDGWRFADGELWSPSDERFTAQDLAAYRWKLGEIDALRRALGRDNDRADLPQVPVVGQGDRPPQRAPAAPRRVGV